MKTGVKKQLVLLPRRILRQCLPTLKRQASRFKNYQLSTLRTTYVQCAEQEALLAVGCTYPVYYCIYIACFRSKGGAGGQGGRAEFQEQNVNMCKRKMVSTKNDDACAKHYILLTRFPLHPFFFMVLAKSSTYQSIVCLPSPGSKLRCPSREDSSLACSKPPHLYLAGGRSDIILLHDRRSPVTLTGSPSFERGSSMYCSCKKTNLKFSYIYKMLLNFITLPRIFFF